MVKNSAEKLRFGIVGAANTAIDFGILFGLRALGLPVVTANIISTGTAFCFSFLANKKYTFRTTDTDIKREIIYFVAVTLFGLWVLQTIIIQLMLVIVATLALDASMKLLAAKLVATTVSLVWNYVLYSRVVFRTR